MPNKTVVLSHTIMGHRPYKTLEFREPKFREWAELGEPFVWVPAGNEMSRRVDDTKVIADYAARLLVEDGKAGDPLILEQVGMADTRAIRDTILSFFPGSGVSEPSPTSPANSSSTPASMPEPSMT